MKTLLAIVVFIRAHRTFASATSSAHAAKRLPRAALRYRRVIALLPEGNAARPLAMAELVACLRVMCVTTGDVEHLDEGVRWGRLAASLVEPTDPEAVIALGNLAGVLLHRFEVAGDRADLEESIDCSRAVLDLPSDATTTPVAARYNNLANALRIKFECDGDARDLEEAVGHGRRAVREITGPATAQCRYVLSTLMLKRYMTYGNLVDLREAIDHNDVAIAAPARHPNMSGYLAHSALLATNMYLRTQDEAMATIARTRFARALELADRIPAGKPVVIANFTQAMASIGADPHGQLTLPTMLPLLRTAVREAAGTKQAPVVLASLNVTLLKTHLTTPAPACLDEAIHAGQEAVRLTEPGHPDLCRYRATLAAALIARSVQRDDPDDLAHAISNLEAAAGHDPAPAEDRMSAAQSLGDERMTSGQATQAARAYRHAVSLLPLAAWPGSDRQTREHQLSRVEDLSVDAAAAQLSAGATASAVEVLDGGRAVLWTHVLHVRTSLDDVDRFAPDLATRMRAVRVELEAAGR